jgi:hypothetical protein
MFLTDGNAQRLATRSRARSLDKWRDAAQLVGARWEVFLEAEPENRAWAFAFYITALDGEEAAAAEMAGLLSSTAAAA